MTPKKTIAGLSATAIIMGGIDASALAETPLDRTEMVAEEIVQAKQIGNVVETTLPWKDQAGIKVKYDMGEPTLSEKFKDKRNKEVITETVDFGDGGFKVDILLNEKPDTNVFCYQIEGAENYDFFYQPPLTDEEIAEGAYRPDNIVGSYAVYHKTLKNHREGAENYATGKVMHIPRPQVWELDNQTSTTEWADLSYMETEGLCVTVRQEFLDKATYPVRVDPTFGYTKNGVTTYSGTDHLVGTRFTVPSDFSTFIAMYGFKQGINESNWKGVITNSSRVIITDGVSDGTWPIVDNSWNILPYSVIPNLSTSTDYFFGFVMDGINAPSLYDTGYTANYGNTDNTNSYLTPTNPSDGTLSDRKYSIYISYNNYVPPVVVSTTTYSCSGGICGGVNLSGGMNLR